MIFLRNRFIFLVCLCISIGLLTACGTPSPSLLSANTIAQQVGTHYQDAHPHISEIKSTQAEGPSHDPMYVMLITGHFQKGQLVATSISFSALANRMYIWFIYAYDKWGREVWFDHELAPTSPQSFVFYRLIHRCYATPAYQTRSSVGKFQSSQEASPHHMALIHFANAGGCLRRGSSHPGTPTGRRPISLIGDPSDETTV